MNATAAIRVLGSFIGLWHEAGSAEVQKYVYDFSQLLAVTLLVNLYRSSCRQNLLVNPSQPSAMANSSRATHS
jgi:hypothetical protein